MPTPLRIEFTGAFYHVIAKGAQKPKHNHYNTKVQKEKNKTNSVIYNNLMTKKIIQEEFHRTPKIRIDSIQLNNSCFLPNA